MPRIIALAQQKGGVGKSTLAIHMAVELTVRGKSVAILDLDHQQGTVTKWRERRDAEWPLVRKADAAHLSDALKALPPLDYVFLDLPGRRGPDMLAGMRSADFILVPARPLGIDIEASSETIAAAQRMRKPYAFVMTVVPPDGRRATEFTKLIGERGLPVLPAVIGARLAYPDAIAEGLGVAEYEPNGKAAAEMSAFTAIVLKGMK